MLLSHKNNHPIRVLRSAKVNSDYSPTRGLRYDGLYKITNYAIIEPSIALHCFTLVREEGQEPIYYQVPEVRPSEPELDALEKDREMQRMGA